MLPKNEIVARDFTRLIRSLMTPVNVLWFSPNVNHGMVMMQTGKLAPGRERYEYLLREGDEIGFIIFANPDDREELESKMREHGIRYVIGRAMDSVGK